MRDTGDEVGASPYVIGIVACAPPMRRPGAPARENPPRPRECQTRAA
ncbi:hypothetical protein HMPREF0970_02329 [Schaalia odontolytica F0309]|uniref:Uncharacterized protein n=1 Tax=Schaalia odontolytica F0309 TaxID=649742 RepID=D4U274_9ACTO|nr:hypothetical protein HMPREF0970_02329 [Schaalia odontolytica F0309]